MPLKLVKFTAILAKGLFLFFCFVYQKMGRFFFVFCQSEFFEKISSLETAPSKKSSPTPNLSMVLSPRDPGGSRGKETQRSKDGTTSLLFTKCVQLKDRALTEERLSLSLPPFLPSAGWPERTALRALSLSLSLPSHLGASPSSSLSP